MRQPLMLLTTGIPPAQAEALYDALLEDKLMGRLPCADTGTRVGDDWDDDTQPGTASGKARTQSAAYSIPRRMPARGH